MGSHLYGGAESDDLVPSPQTERDGIAPVRIAKTDFPRYCRSERDGPGTVQCFWLPTRQEQILFL